MNKYETLFLDCASKLDAMVESHGKITKLATSIIEDQDNKDTIDLLKVIEKIAKEKNSMIEVAKMAVLLKDSLVRFYGHKKIVEICSLKEDIEEDEKKLDDLLYELNALIGLDKVKEKVNDLISYQKVQRMRLSLNLHTSKSTLHLAFIGNPGTGKTTVARIVGRIYKQIGLLSKGHFVEVSRTDLIAGYQGQTALKVKHVIEKAKGGVLFIDEAYSITENDHSDSYGKECLTELTKALEDYRDDLVVIVAGYTEPMKKFFDSNPGLKSRFNTFIEFEDYSVEKLSEILISICNANDYKINDSTMELIKDYLSKIVSEKTDTFANGRMVRNIYDTLIMNHAKRVIKISNPKREDLATITDEDFYLINSIIK